MSLHYGPIANALQLVVAGPQDLYKLEGFWNGADGLYLQIHDSATTAGISTSTLIKSYYLQGAFVYSWSGLNDGISVANGLVIAVSTTNVTYTAYGGTVTDLVVECEIGPTKAVNPDTLTVAGDLTTGVNHLLVWNNASGPKKLYQVDVISLQVPPAFLCLFAKDSIVAGDLPLIITPLVMSSAVQTFTFGSAGLVLYQKTSLPVGGITPDTGGVESKSLYIGIGLPNAAGFFAGYTEDTSLTNNIRAYYADMTVQAISVKV